MIVLADSYSEINFTNGTSDNYQSSNIPAQTFQAVQGTIDSIYLYMQKTGTSRPNDNISVSIFGHTGTWGVSGRGHGAALASSGYVQESTVGLSYSLIKFSFTGANRITLGATYYTFWFYSIGTSNASHFQFGLDTDTPTYGGNFAPCVNGQWQANNTVDTCFYVYEDVTSTTKNEGLMPFFN